MVHSGTLSNCIWKHRIANSPIIRVRVDLPFLYGQSSVSANNQYIPLDGCTDGSRIALPRLDLVLVVGRWGKEDDGVQNDAHVLEEHLGPVDGEHLLVVDDDVDDEHTMGVLWDLLAIQSIVQTTNVVTLLIAEPIPIALQTKFVVPVKTSAQQFALDTHVDDVKNSKKINLNNQGIGRSNTT